MAKKHTRLFNPKFLEEQLKEFSLDTIPNINEAKTAIAEWNRKIKEGIVDITKEESQNPLFAECIFERALGYRKSISYEGKDEWNLVLEKKTETDGTKSDLALGFFTSHSSLTRVVVELKDSSHKNLDAKQKRSDDKRTPIEQAFSYAHKQGEKCKWVIVANYLEIRFYLSNDSTKYERFYIEKLNTEEEEFKKFIFLLHKTRLISKTFHSQIEKIYQSNNLYNEIRIEENTHILDKIYNCIKKFDGFGYVNPQIISNAYPFNENFITDNYAYHNFSLSTNNSEVFDFFSKIQKVDNKFSLNNEISNVFDSNTKFEFILSKLNKWLIYKIYKHNEFVDICLEQDYTCDCILCNYNKLKLDISLLRSLDLAGRKEDNNLKEAYYLYIHSLQKYKYAYNTYENIRNNSLLLGKDIEYILSSYNQKKISNLISNNIFVFNKNERKYTEDSRKIDLRKEIHHTLSISVDKDIRKALLELVEESFIHKMYMEVNGILERLLQAQRIFINGGDATGNGENRLFYLQLQLINYVKGNFLVYNYAYIQSDILKSMIVSYHLHLDYGEGVNNIPFIVAHESIHNLVGDQMEKLTSNYVKSSIEIEDIQKIISMVVNLLDSFSTKSSSGHYINKEFVNIVSLSPFKEKVERFINNSFNILSVTKLSKNQINDIQSSLLIFINYSLQIGNSSFKGISLFIKRQSNNIDNEFIVYFLENIIKINHDKYFKYKNLILVLCNICRIRNLKLNIPNIHYKLFVTFSLTYAQDIPSMLVDFYDIVSHESQKYLKSYFIEHLKNNFNSYFYYLLLIYEIVQVNEFEEYFNLYVKEEKQGIVMFNNRDEKYKVSFLSKKMYNQDFLFFIQIIYINDLYEHKTIKSEFENITDCESWLINPIKFNYDNFAIEWLSFIDGWGVILEKMGTIKELKIIIENYLKENPTDTKISEMYFRFFA